MKKLMIAMLVLVAVGVYAKDETPSGPQAVFHYDNGKFIIDSDGYMQLNYEMDITKPGQVNDFGYYIIDSTKPLTKDDLKSLDTKPQNKDTIPISGLQKDQSIGFYLKTKKADGEGYTVVLSTATELADDFGENIVSFTKLESGSYTFGDSHWTSYRVLGFDTTPAPSDPSAPTGQPLPGALTTMLIAGGCAAFLRKRKAARK